MYYTLVSPINESTRKMFIPQPVSNVVDKSSNYNFEYFSNKIFHE